MYELRNPGLYVCFCVDLRDKRRGDQNLGGEEEIRENTGGMREGRKEAGGRREKE